MTTHDGPWIPEGWTLEHTGGNCTALVRRQPEACGLIAVMTWRDVDGNDDPSTPDGPEEYARVSIYAAAEWDGEDACECGECIVGDGNSIADYYGTATECIVQALNHIG